MVRKSFAAFAAGGVRRDARDRPHRRAFDVARPGYGNQYTVTPTRTDETGTGPCREYMVDAVIGGETQKVYGTACRQADGSWRVIA